MTALPAYIRQSLPEWAFLALSAWGLSASVVEGFVSGDGYPMRLPALIAAVVCLLLYAAVYRRRLIVIGVAGVLAACAAMVAAAVALSTGEDPYADAAGCYLWPTMACIVCSLAGFCLSRTRPGAILWLVACSFGCSLAQAMFEGGHVGFAVMATLGSMALLLWRNTAKAQLEAEVLSRVSLPANAAVALVPAAAVMGLAALLWLAVVSPLNPGALHLELIPEWRTQPVVELRGVGDTRMQVNTDAKSTNLTEGERWTTDQLKVDQDAEKTVPAKEAQAVARSARQSASEDQSNIGQGSGGSREKVSSTDPEQRWDQISYELDLPVMVGIVAAALLLVAAVVAYFLLRRRRRRQRLDAWLEGDRASLVTGIYLFLMEKQARMGFRVPDGVTLAEFGSRSARNMEGLREQTHVPFSALTETYQRCAYGGHQPTEEEAAPFVTYYLWFWKAARAHLGNLRYFFKSFRLG